MYPWNSFNPERDSTLRIIHECVLRGHETAIIHSGNLSIIGGNVYGICEKIRPFEKVPVSIKNFYYSVKFDRVNIPLKSFDVIFMRDNPPIDPFVLNFLDAVKDDVFIVNNINGLREANNKIYPASFYDPNSDIIPNTYVSKDIDLLMEIIANSSSEKMILKPLDGYGGKGVIIIEKSAMANIRSLLDFYIRKHENKPGYVILQEYVEGAEKGDVRVLILNGKPIGAIRRVPAKNDFRSNISSGGSVEKHSLTKNEIKICNKIGKKTS